MLPARFQLDRPSPLRLAVAQVVEERLPSRAPSTRRLELGDQVAELDAVPGVERVEPADRAAGFAVFLARSRVCGSQPTTTSTGQRVAGLRLGDRRAHALLQALLVFRLLIPTGFGNRDLRELLTGLLEKTPGEISTGQVTYDLRRLRAHGLITRIPGTHRYQLTETAGDHAMLLTHLHTRLLQPGLAQLTDPNPPTPSALRTAANAYQRALDKLTAETGLAA